MEQQARWRMDDQLARGVLVKSGAGTLGQGIAGSTTIRAGESFSHVDALSKTLSMPALGPIAPCGRRVGDDLGVADRMEDLEVPPLRRPVRLSGDLEDRLQCLESSFSGSMMSRSGTLFPPSTGGRATGRRTASSRGSLRSSMGGSRYGGSALPTPLFSQGRQSSVATPLMR
eukprot:TRINITY_DN89563_c0_g1_i1.p1 TRINITY_DN89563_c0_g1~~TRINITY_DN89563_c0_g1_i1.p1  ORF type:complete len:193 (+),score=18.30 TRINITY_DN89563_c0_g1_i1:65-580(+)